MPNPRNIETLAEIKSKLSGVSTIVLADYRGLTVKEMQALRTKMREAGCELKVYKNTLFQIALRELDMPAMDDLLAGPSIFAFSSDAVAPAKAFVDFAKTAPKLEVKGGLVDGHVYAEADIKAIAALPSREQLIAKLMGSMTAPVQGFMRVANGPAAAFARVVQAVADQKAA